MMMRRWSRSMSTVWWLLSLAAETAHGQAPPALVQCMAPSQGGPSLIWWNGRGSGAPDSAELAANFAGRFDIVEVQTEGSGERHLRRWQLALVSADTAAQRCGPAMCGPKGRSGRVYPLHGAVLSPDVRWDSASARKGESFGRADAWLRVDEHPFALTLAIGPPRTLDVGTFYQIREVNGPSGAAFTGRWDDGGISMSMLTVDSVTVGERGGGYFCATRAK